MIKNSEVVLVLKVGLTSVTFRNLGYKEIIEACKKCEIEYIEWGSDVHVPADDVFNAKKSKKHVTMQILKYFPTAHIINVVKKRI